VPKPLGKRPGVRSAGAGDVVGAVEGAAIAQLLGEGAAGVAFARLPGRVDVVPEEDEHAVAGAVDVERERLVRLRAGVVAELDRAVDDLRGLRGEEDLRLVVAAPAVTVVSSGRSSTKRDAASISAG
jgi:hypothetical protein